MFSQSQNKNENTHLNSDMIEEKIIEKSSKIIEQCVQMSLSNHATSHVLDCNHQSYFIFQFCLLVKPKKKSDNNYMGCNE